MIKPDPTIEIPRDLGRVHFVGIGGSGMSGIASMMLTLGIAVSGSDRTANAATAALEAQGATIFIGHDAANVRDADTLVVTSALWPDNPELVFAQQHGLTVLHRSQALVWLSRGRRVIAIAGAHGKTTSTGMLVTALDYLGESPSFVNGGVIEALGVSSRIGTGELFVVEADESDGSFLFYDTESVLITNVDADHLDHYGTQEHFEDAFVKFASKPLGAIVASGDDSGTTHVLDRLDAAAAARVLRFGEFEGNAVRVTSITEGPTVAFTVRTEGASVDVALQVPGRHNAINASGVIAVLLGLGFSLEDAARGVERFTGTKRRFEFHGEVRGVRVYDDYAHHPTEVRAALSAVRDVVGSGRIIAVHQPHLYSRTQRMAAEFAAAFEELADETVVLDVDGAREDPVPGVTGALVAERFSDQTRVRYAADWDTASVEVARIARDGDFVVTFGCGNVYRIIPSVLESLSEESSAVAPGDGA